MRHILDRIHTRYYRDGISGIVAASFWLLLRRMGLFPALVQLRQWREKRRYDLQALREPFQTVYVDPEQIQYYLFPDYRDRYRWYGRILSGEWDIKAKKLEKTSKFQGVIQRYGEGRDWKETVVFDHMLDLVEDGKRPDGCTTVAEIEQRYEAIDRLYNRIRSEGFQSGDELQSNRGEITDVCVAVGRDGRLLLQGDGNHRVAIARVLSLDEIPVKISMRHLQWQRTRDAIATGDRELGSLSDHPDVEDLVDRSSE